MRAAFIKPFYRLQVNSPFMNKLTGIQWNSKRSVWPCPSIYFGVGNDLWVLWHQFGGLPTAKGSHEFWTLGAHLFTWRALKYTFLLLWVYQKQNDNVAGPIQVFYRCRKWLRVQPTLASKHWGAWTLGCKALWNLKHEAWRASRLNWVRCLLYAPLYVPLKHDKSFLYQRI